MTPEEEAFFNLCKLTFDQGILLCLLILFHVLIVSMIIYFWRLGKKWQRYI